MFNIQLKGDRVIWAVTILLALISTLVVYSSIVTLAYKHQQGNTLYYLFRHSVFLLVGLAITYYISRVKFAYFSKISLIAIIISIPLLLVTLLTGANINDASRWLVIPIINQTFQTSDLAKLALLMYVARTLALKQHDMGNFKTTYLPIIIPILITCGLIFPANFSTAAVLFMSCILLMFIGRVKIKFLIGTLLTAILIGGLALLIAVKFPDLLPRAKTWSKRIENFKGGNKADSDSNYQSEQSKIAIAIGGPLGKGPGKSTQRNFLPHPYSDFIYAIVIEEYGMLGGVFVLFLYLILLFRCVKIINKTDRIFGKLLVAGISFTMVFQALINMGVATNLLPVTGQPLPMVSMGGTSIWFTCLSIGIILSVSASQEDAEKEKEKPKADSDKQQDQKKSGKSSSEDLPLASI